METYEKKYSDRHVPLSPKQRQLYERLENLILAYNQNLKEEVIRAKEKYNLKIRSVIGDKTGLSLIYRNKDFKLESDNKEKLSISVRIEDKVPLSLLSLLEKCDIRLIELLLHYRKIKSSIQELEYQSGNYSTYKTYHRGAVDQNNLISSVRHLKILAEEVEKSGILRDIQQLGPDVLGSYFLKDSHIELYWLCIGLCSILYDSPVEYFTLIVLMHELIHGYTHIGFDKDGNAWETNAFGSSDLRIIEGLAEYYSELLCHDYFDFVIEPFNSLKEKAGEEYTAYKQWFDTREKDKYEKVRQLLLICRTKNIKIYNDFLVELSKIKQIIY